MRPHGRTGSLLTCAAFLAWVGSGVVAHRHARRYHEQRSLNERKQIASLRLNETVPGLREKRERLARHMADLIRILGVAEPGKHEHATVDQVASLVIQEIRRLDSALGVLRYIPERDRCLQGPGPLDGKGEPGLPLFRADPDLRRRLGPIRRDMEGIVRLLWAAVEALEGYRRELQARLPAARLARERDEIMRTFIAQIAESTAEKTALENDIQRLRQEIENEEQRAKRELAILNQKIRDAMVRSPRKPGCVDFYLPRPIPSGPRPWSNHVLDQAALEAWDGEVHDAGDLFLDLGSAHQAAVGLRFLVYRPSSARGCLGTVEVTQVRDHLSRVRVVELADSRQPIARGDRLLNPLYRRPAERARPLRLAFVGKFPFEPRATVTPRLAQMGVTVQERVDHWTDFVVSGRDYDRDPDYRKAGDIGAVVIAMEQLRQVLSD